MGNDKKLTLQSEDFSAWYNEVVQRAELADHSPVRGSMVIRPWGYGIWEHMQSALDAMFKETGHENAYFPLLIPMSFIEREKEHIEGFAPELAVVTRAGGKELEEPYVIRPTSETIVYSMYAKWVQSYRDLPVLLNQWANVIRWEMRTRLFLRTSEFLWQEGHTAHATAEEAEEETLLILELYRKFMDEWLAMPPITGLKTDSEKFAGAVSSYSCEALMKDRKALQTGTSHFLGQNFSKQFELTFQSEDGKEEYAWNTSWGVSTRLVGGVVMTHGDDNGLVIPPRLAPTQVVIIPILAGEETSEVLAKADEVLDQLKNTGVRARIDNRDHLSPGAKYFEWERKGVPFRVEIGPRDLEKGQLALVRRLTAEGESRRAFVPEAEAIAKLPEKLEEFQDDLLEAARVRREDSTVRGVGSLGELEEAFDSGAGFVYTGWSGDPAIEEMVKERLKATIRVLPSQEFRSVTAPSRCVSGDRESVAEVVWARAY
ncbi:MAG TPA: proline--tRNA ligase [Gemmatimonadetes bacterium]|jgi:prolyl-tRNA synthetase|nr:proline--tRNA ligase [Gemmatimonadota bacterium]HIB09020.1 proline--tRNA ligase [Gemmatimonadota bacterium]HIN78675.1 proline--tRNA ligase [Gemmatimonadota bacterium]